MKFYKWLLDNQTDPSVTVASTDSGSRIAVRLQESPDSGGCRVKGVRPFRDKAIICILNYMDVSVRQLAAMNIDDLFPNNPQQLRQQKSVIITVSKSESSYHNLPREVALTLVEYLERERKYDSTELSKALFLNSTNIPNRNQDGRLSLGTIYRIYRRV